MIHGHLNEIISLSDNPVFTQPKCIWGKENSREIFQTLNPKLQVIKVACNSQLLKSSSSSHATLTASFSFSSSKPSLHLGLSRSSTICGCDTWIQSQPKAITEKDEFFPEIYSAPPQFSRTV